MDEILQDVRERREAFAREFNDDMDAIHRDILEKQEERIRAGYRYASFPPATNPNFDTLASGEAHLASTTSPTIPEGQPVS